MDLESAQNRLNIEFNNHKELINDSADSSYQIVRYEPAFNEQIVALQRYLWGPNVALNAAYLTWKYGKNPYVDETLIYLALCDGQVVGMLGSFGVQWEIGQTTKLRSLSLADLVIEPAHRNRKLFPALIKFVLADLAQRNYPFIFDLTASPEVAVVMLMNGWRSLHLQTAHRSNVQQAIATTEHSSWLRTGYHCLRSYAKNSPLLAVGYRKLRFIQQRLSASPAISQSAHPFQRFDHNYTQRKAQNAAPITVQTAPRPAQMIELLSRLPKDQRIRHTRDEQYLTWRFQNPLARYRFLFWADTQLEGYLILQTNRQAQADTAWVNVVDWEATNEQVRTDLLKAALTWGEFKEVELWSATLAEQTKTRLDQAGFCFHNRTGSAVRDGRGERVMLYSLPPERVQSAWTLGNYHLLDLANWDIRMIYSDAV